MVSTADLTVHIFFLLRLCDSCTAKPPMAPVNQPPLQADYTPQDSPLSWKIASCDSQWAVGKHGVTYPLGFTDDTLTNRLW